MESWESMCLVLPKESKSHPNSEDDGSKHQHHTNNIHIRSLVEAFLKQNQCSLLLEPAVDQSWELVEEVAQREKKYERKKLILSLDLPGCQLVCASCLEYTTCSLKLNWENVSPWASTFCHMLLPEPYIRPKLSCLSRCCQNFLPQNPEEKWRPLFARWLSSHPSPHPNLQ